MGKLFPLMGAVALVGLGAFALATPKPSIVQEKVYVALEGSGAVAVLEHDTVTRTIDLTDANGTRYMAHNVQVAPNGSSVAVTANVDDNSMQMQMSDNPHMQMPSTPSSDEVVLIDPRTDTITKRIPIGPESHLAHVVYEPDSTSVWVTLQQKDVVDKVDLTTGAVVQSVDLGAKSGPHGLRITPDGTTAIVALMGKGVAFVDTKTGAVRKESLPGAVVQTAVTADGAYAFATVYDTKQVAWFSLRDGSHGLIDLPNDAKGPVQLYPTPDSKYVYVADQGHYFDQPNGSAVYRVNVANKTIDRTIVGGNAPHGVVVSANGPRVYVTNLLGNDVSVIDTSSNRELTRIPVGIMPNGISVWSGITQ